MNRYEQHVAELGVETIIECLSEWVSPHRLERIDTVLEHRLKSLTVVLVNLHDPHNGAAALRTIEGMGIQNIHVVEGQEPFRLSRKVAIGSQQWVTVHRYPTFENCAKALSCDEYVLCAAIPNAREVIDELPNGRKVALVFGNERDGLADSVVNRCQRKFTLPMWGFGASYNLSVSVALALNAISARFRMIPSKIGDLGDSEKIQLKALWLYRSVRASDQLLQKLHGNGRG